MNTELSVFAPAKVNLFLEATEKLPSGYHNIATLFAKISLGDDLKISAKKAERTTIEIKCRGPFGKDLKEDKTNLVYKAAQAFFDYFEIKADCKIRLEKNIPTGSGLGGGSSDAAAVILALCKIFNIETNAKRVKDLIKIAAKIGADVPFFLYPDTFCKAEGIGEVLTPVKNNIISPFIIIAYPGVPSDTKAAYAKLKLNEEKKILTNISMLNKIVEAVERGAPLNEWGPLLYNKLEDCVVPYIEPVAKLKKEMENLGADIVLMSGSGASVFALVSDKKKGERVVSEISKDSTKTAFLTHFWRTKYEDNGNKDSSYGGGAS